MILELLQSHGITPRKKAVTHGGEWASPCPVCGGSDRFLVWPKQGEHGTWYCRGCGKGGDVIEFLRVFDGLSFADACARLGVAREYNHKPLTLPKAKRPEAFNPKKHSAPEQLWQGKAAALLAHAHEQLMGNAAELSRLEARGLPLEAVQHFRLGWLPGEGARNCYFRGRAAWGLPPKDSEEGRTAASAEGRSETGPRSRRSDLLWIPRGLVVPALGAAGEALRLRVRRPDADRERFLPELKYYVLPGSCMAPLLLPPMENWGYRPKPHPGGIIPPEPPYEGVWGASCPPGGRGRRPALAWVVVESELDAMACAWGAARAGLPLGALAVGTSRGKPDAAAHAALESGMAILVALDFDAPDAQGRRPGTEGFPWWQGQYRQARRWPVSQGKDPGEAVALGMDLAAWLRAGLPPALTHKAILKHRQFLSMGRWTAGLSNAGVLGARVLSCLERLRLHAPESGAEALAMLARLNLEVVPFLGGLVVQGEGQGVLSGEEWGAVSAWKVEYQDLISSVLGEGVRVSPQSANSAGRPDDVASAQELPNPHTARQW